MIATSTVWKALDGTPAVKKALRPQKINWKIRGHWATSREHVLLYRDDSLGVQCELVSGINKSGNPRGEGRWYYFVDGDKREFGTQDELMAALVGER